MHFGAEISHRESGKAGGLESASVLIVGAGALGCPAASTLAAAGVGRLTVIDPDVVELSNLQRQPLYSDTDIGSSKAVLAAQALTTRYPGVAVAGIQSALGADNATALIEAHDYVIDATDSPATKYLTNDISVATGTPYSYAGVLGTGGQTLPVLPGRTACLRCVFDPSQGEVGGDCSSNGILAPVAGVIGTLTAAHALARLAPDASRPDSAGTLFVYELRGRRWRRIGFPKRTDCACGTAAQDQDVRADTAGRPQPCPS